MLNKSTDYILYDDNDKKYENYKRIVDEIENLIEYRIIVIGNMNHNYAGYENFRNKSGQIGIFNSFQDFIDNSLTMQNTEYVKIHKYGNKLLINTACHDYSTYLEIRQATKLATEFNNQYSTNSNNFNLHDNIWSYKFFCKEPKDIYHDTLLNMTENLICLNDFEECLNISIKMIKAGIDIYD